MRYRDTRDDDANVHAMVTGAGAKLEAMATEQTPDTTPALLSAAPACSAADMARAIEFAQRLTASGTCDDGTLMSRALLASRAHLDALPPRAPVDGEALGRRAWRERASPESRERYPEFEALMDEVWETQSAEERARYQRIGTALHAIGYAAGRSEGEMLPYVCPCCYHQRGDEVPADGRSTREEMAAAIARLTAALADLPTLYQDQVRESQRLAAALERMEDERDGATAELAEARADRSHGPIADAALLAAKLYHDADNQSVQLAQIRAELDACRQEVAAARLDGAREEREAILLRLSHLRETWTNMNEGDALFVLAQIVGAIEERGPTPTKENSR